MILSRNDIKMAIEQGQIIIEPEPTDDDYSPSSVDLRLGDEFYGWDKDTIEQLGRGGLSNVLDPSRWHGFRELSTVYTKTLACDTEGCCIINPGSFVLAITHERIELPIESRLAARVEGRSSIARLGLAIHLTAPTIHAGWKGTIALEIVNFGDWPMKLRPKELRVCQLIVEQVMGGSVSSSPASQFLDQDNPRG